MKTHAIKNVICAVLLLLLHIPTFAIEKKASTPTQSAKPTRVQVARILTAKIDRTYENGAVRNTFALTGTSAVRIKKVNFRLEDDSTLTASIATTPFDSKTSDILVVEVGDKIFVPFGFGGDTTDALWSIEIRDVDAKSVEILNGKPLPPAPKESLNIEYTPRETKFSLGAPIEVDIKIDNIGKTPLDIFYITWGGGNYLCRDAQLSFTATRDGEPVAPNPKPLPEGFISPPFTLRTKSDLNRSEDLCQWLQFDKAGKYEISASYRVKIKNPQVNSPVEIWNVTYENKFSLTIGD